MLRIIKTSILQTGPHILKVLQSSLFAFVKFSSGMQFLQKLLHLYNKWDIFFLENDDLLKMNFVLAGHQGFAGEEVVCINKTEI